MKKIKYLIFVVFCFVFTNLVKAQQMPFYTQWMFNEYLINPGVAGTFNAFQIRANSRIQWMGITDAPRTMGISAYGPLKKLPMGYGGYIYNDITGPESRLTLGGSYAYNYQISDLMHISAGLSVGLVQYTLDGTKIYMGEEEDNIDPAFTGSKETAYAPDATLGIYVYSTRYFAGISAHQLLGSKLNGLTEMEIGVNRLTQHYYLVGGYTFILNREFSLTPSLLFKYMTPGQYQIEINAKTTYKRVAWFGLTYRNPFDACIMGGYVYENKYYIGLSYDIVNSELGKYTSGTIEIMLGVRFDNIK